MITGQQIIEEIAIFLEKEGFQAKILTTYEDEDKHEFVITTAKCSLSYTYHSLPYKCYIDIKYKVSRIIFYVVPAIIVQDDFLVPIAEFIARANFDEAFGLLELNLSNGEPRYKKIIEWQEFLIPMEQIKASLHAGFNKWETYLPLFEAIMNDGISPEEAMNSSLVKHQDLSSFFPPIKSGKIDPRESPEEVQVEDYDEAVARIKKAKKKGLTKLDLGDLGLRSLPPNLFKLIDLTALNLEDNQLTKLPKSISKLTNLTQLNLSGNKLTKLPSSISELTNLTELDLGFNGLEKFPENISKLGNLTFLNLGENKLVTLSKSISKLTNLAILNLVDNQLTSLPQSFSKLTHLTTLDLSENKLAKLPNSISKLANLSSLTMQYNQFKDFPSSISKMSNLSELWMAYNQLTIVPDEISNCKKLQILSLANNNIYALSSELGKLNHLKSLYLNGNKLRYLPENFSYLSNLTALSLRGNSFNVSEHVYNLNPEDQIQSILEAW